MVTTTNTLIATLNFARSEAIRQSRPVSVCASGDQASCNNGDWNQGWIVFTDEGTAGIIDGADKVLLVDQLLDKTQNISLGGRTYLQFQPTGILVAYCTNCLLPARQNDIETPGLFQHFSLIPTVHAGGSRINQDRFNQLRRQYDNGCRGQGHIRRSHQRHDCSSSNTTSGQQGNSSNAADSGHDNSTNGQSNDDDSETRNAGDSENETEDRNTGDEAENQDDEDRPVAGQDNPSEIAAQPTVPENDSEETTAGSEGGNDASGTDTDIAAVKTAAIDSSSSAGASTSPRSFTICHNNSSGQTGRAIDISLGGRIRFRRIQCP